MNAQSNSIQESLTLFTIEEVAKIFKIGRSKAYLLISSGELKAIKLRGNTRITPEALREYIKKQPPFPVEPAIKKRLESQVSA